MKKVTILGKGIGWGDAPEGNCWAVCSAVPGRYSHGKTVQMSFDIHVPEIEDSDHDSWESVVNRHGIPQYMCEVTDRVPTSLKYPLEDIIKKYDTDYFSCSISYMLALAVFRGHEEINIYGVTMTEESEYTYQRSNVEFWIGIAKGAGIKVNIHGQRSTLLTLDKRIDDGKLYGFLLKQRKKKE